MANQLALFEEKEVKLPVEENVQLVIGGIYTDKDPNDQDPSAPYAICFGGNAFRFIFDGITHIDEIVELGCAHKMKLVEGYALAMLTKETHLVLQIRDSGKKGQDDYILWECQAPLFFRDSMKRYLQIFHK